ncbi:MAG TPA: hypothetical protein VJ843_00265 [Candidatus Saccharimonadales bacterium]|nr:hypothetical protein [Candidatus Saccharimonadales bacterium]
MKKKVSLTIGACCLTLLVLLLATDPTQMPSFVLILPFSLLFTIIWLITFSSFRKNGFTRLRAIRLSMLFAGLPVSLLLLQSIGQLTIWDIITILAFFGLAYFYVSRLAVSSSNN